MGSFVDLLVKAKKEQWCVRPFCTTCGSRDFRTHLAEIESLAEDLLKTHPLELLVHPSWSRALRIAAYDFRLMDWDSILQSWLSKAGGNINFLDHVFFYLIENVLCKSETREKWANVCIETALDSKDPSLLESLIRVLGVSAATRTELIETALEVSLTNHRLHQALVKSGYLRREDEIRASKMRQRASKNLLAAIRRRDIKAIESMLRWKPDISEKNQDGISIADTARLSNDNRIHVIFDAYLFA